MDEENVDQPWWMDAINAVGSALGPQTTKDGSKIYTTPSLSGGIGMGPSSVMIEKPSGEFQLAGPFGVQTIDSRADKRNENIPTQAEIAAGTRSAADYFNAQEKAAREAVRYSPRVFDAATGVLDQYQKQYEQLLGGPQGLSAQVEGAYGAAAGRGREGAQNIYREGQRAAGAIDALYGGAAARAEGLAAGQGLGTPTALSGITPVSGSAVYTPTTTRAYGATIADYTGAEAGLSSRDLAAQNASRGRGRQTLDQWAQTNMTGIRMRLDMAHATAKASGLDAEDKAAADVARQRAADKFGGNESKQVLLWMEDFWENGKGDVHKRVTKTYNDKEEFLAAVTARTDMNSQREFEKWWMQYTVPQEMMGSAPLFGGTAGSIF